MSDYVKIALIAASTLVILFLVFRNRLTRLLIRFKQLEAELDAAPSAPAADARPSPALQISGNRQIGSDNRIETRGVAGEISENLQEGDSNTIKADNSSR